MMKLGNIQNSKPKIILLFVICYLLIAILCGCEAFRKKFVRKPKKKEIEVVIHTKEYESKYSIEQVYKRYFTFWRAWNAELVNSLHAQDVNHKKQAFAAKRIIENLQQMRELLLPQMQARLNVFISEQKGVVEELQAGRLNYAQQLHIKSILENQRREIQKEFKYKKIEKFLVKE